VSALLVALAFGSVPAASAQQDPTAPRPQEPRPPFPYRVVEARYANPAAPGGTLRALPGLNHMFQAAKTGAMEEAGQSEETFAPSALRLIADWITTRTQ
jgi:hypothetical protein